MAEVQVDQSVPEVFRRAISAREASKSEGQVQSPATVETPAESSQTPEEIGSAPPAAEGAVQVGSGQDVSQQVVPETGTPPEGAAPVPVTSPADAPPEAPAWDPRFLVTPEMSKEQRYKVIAGMQRAESKRFRETTAALERQIEELRAAPKPAAPVATAGTPAPVVSADSEAELKALEADLSSGAGDYHTKLERWMQLKGYVRKADLDPLKQEVQAVRGEVGGVAKTVQATTQDVFLRELGDMAPDYEVKNKMPGFKEFLDTRPPGSLYTYKESAMRANSEGNAAALAEIFNLYSPDSAPAVPTPVASSKKPNPKLASPPRTTGAPPAPKPAAQPEMLKESDYIKLATDAQNGKYSSDDPVKDGELKAKLASEKLRFVTARAEGRWIPNSA